MDADVLVCSDDIQAAEQVILLGQGSRDAGLLCWWSG